MEVNTKQARGDLVDSMVNMKLRTIHVGTDDWTKHPQGNKIKQHVTNKRKFPKHNLLKHLSRSPRRLKTLFTKGDN